MASKLNQLRATATGLAKNGATYYKQLIENNKNYIKDPPTIDNCQLLANQLFYTRLASIPGRYEAFWKELDQLKQHLMHGKYELKTEKAGIVALFGVECFAWFCAGEIVGRGFTILGYHV